MVVSKFSTWSELSVKGLTSAVGVLNWLVVVEMVTDVLINVGLVVVSLVSVEYFSHLG